MFGMQVPSPAGYFDNFSEIPREAVLKEDILINGLSFTDDALQGSSYQDKAYFLFTFDKDPPQTVKGRKKIIPQEIRISHGPHGLRPTIIQSRHASDTPYKVDKVDGKLGLFYNHGEEPMADVEFVPRHRYYDFKLSNGMEIDTIAPAIYWGETIDVTAYRVCQYWGEKEECRFCDINENFRAWGSLRRQVGAMIPVELVAEAVDLASKDTTTKRYLITGGAIKDSKKEFEFYYPYIKETEKMLGRKLPCRLNVQGLGNEYLEKFHDAGVDYFHPNLEVWDESLFKMICPGKEKYRGREWWIRQAVEASRIFGVGNVSPNFVAGVEMAHSEHFPFGFTNVDEAVKSTLEGIEFFMTHDVTPKFDNWAVEPLSSFGKLNCKAPPLEFFMKLYAGYYSLKKQYGLPWPQGLGEPGPGRSQVPATAFMDIGT